MAQVVIFEPVRLRDLRSLAHSLQKDGHKVNYTHEAATAVETIRGWTKSGKLPRLPVAAATSHPGRTAALVNRALEIDGFLSVVLYAAKRVEGLKADERVTVVEKFGRLGRTEDDRLAKDQS